MEEPNIRSRRLGVFSSLLAFALSAVMGVGFILLVNRTHDLFSSPAFTEGVPDLVSSLTSPEQLTVVGTWEGKLHDQPAVRVMIDRNGTQLTGTVVFQPVVRTRSGARLSAAPVSLPLKDARFDGKTLRFSFEANQATSAFGESGIEMTLTGANQAALRVAACQRGDWDRAELEEVVMVKTA